MPPKSSSAGSSRSAAPRSAACLRCRKHKSFCTKDKPNCFTCRKGNHECIYPDGRKISVRASYVYELEARIQAYEEAFKSLQSPDPVKGQSEPQAPDQTSSESPMQRSSGEDFELDLHPLTEGLDNLVISPTGKPQYLGSSSSTILGRRLRDMVGMAAPGIGELDIDREIATYNLDALRQRRPSLVEAARLPPYAVAKRYFAAQYTMIGTIFSFVLPDVFEYQLQHAYKGPPEITNRDACLMYCQVLLIMAFGQMYAVNQYTGSEGPPGFGYFTEALRYLPDIHEEPSVLFCGVLALIGYFMQNLNRRDAAFLYLGLAQRMAISLALHEEVSVPGLDGSMKEQRRRTWWSIYSLDRILCVKYGNPVTMHDEDIQVALPSRLPNEEEYCPAVVLRHYTVLSKILGQIMNRIYRKEPKSGSGLLRAVQEIMSSLAKWERDIPDQLRFDPARMTASRESVSTFLHYYQCINMTARPLLFHLVEKRLRVGADRSADWKQGLSQTTVSVIETCIYAARDTISMMTAAAEKNLVAVFGYMDGEHAFSAAIVLVMVCVAFPYDAENTAAMDAALSVLENMANKGNHHIEARYQLLSRLSAITYRPAVAEVRAANTAETRGLQMVAPALPVMDETMLDQMFSYSPGTGDLSIFEAAYTDADMNVDFGLDQWTQAAEGNSE